MYRNVVEILKTLILYFYLKVLDRNTDMGIILI